jgi:hypothetical protein
MGYTIWEQQSRDIYEETGTEYGAAEIAMPSPAALNFVSSVRPSLRLVTTCPCIVFILKYIYTV